MRDKPSIDARPQLRAGCRLAPPSSEEPLLLIPEGALRLQGPARRILELCDGQRTLNDLIEHLQSEFPAVEPQRIAEEVSTYLSNLADRGAIEFQP